MMLCGAMGAFIYDMYLLIIMLFTAQGYDIWHIAYVILDYVKQVQFILRRGTGSYGDMAIDEIEV